MLDSDTTIFPVASEIEAQIYASEKCFTAPVEYKTGAKFGSKCLRDSPVAYIVLSDDSKLNTSSRLQHETICHYQLVCIAQNVDKDPTRN